jgi:hypothetical protein
LTPNSRSIDLTELRKSEKSSTIRKVFWFHASIEIPVTGEKISPEAITKRGDLAAPDFSAEEMIANVNLPSSYFTKALASLGAARRRLSGLSAAPG